MPVTEAGLILSFLRERVGAGAFAIFGQFVDIFQVILNGDGEGLFHSLSIPKSDCRAGKESQIGNVESGAFGPVTHELRKDAFEDQPGDGHCDRVDRRHPDGESGFA